MALTGKVKDSFGSAERLRGYLPVISQNLTTPEDYFKKGAELPQNTRNERFYCYQMLYEGEYSQLVNPEEDFPIVFEYHNYFSQIINMVVDFLMDKPPESSSPMIETLTKALRGAIVSYLLHGTAILAVDEFEGDDGGTAKGVTLIDPRYFYPLDNDDVVTIEPFSNKIMLVRNSLGEQQYEYNDAAEDNWYYPEGRLGEPTGEFTSLPQRTFFPVRAEPYDGEWFGHSVTREAAIAVAATTARDNDFRAQQRLASILLYGVREDPGTQTVADLDAGGAAAVEAGASPLEALRKHGGLLEGYKTLGFLQANMQEGAYTATLDRAEQRVFDVYGMSPSLAKRYQDTGLGAASGTALELIYIRSAATFDKIINAFLPVMEEVLEELGAAAEITWGNPLSRDSTTDEDPAPEGTDPGAENGNGNAGGSE